MKHGFSHRFWTPVPQWCMDLQRQLDEERARQRGFVTYDANWWGVP